MKRFLLIPLLAAASSVAAQVMSPAPADEPIRIRGEVTEVNGSTIVVKTTKGITMPLALTDSVGVFSLTPSSYTDVAFGTYVGAVSVKLGENVFSPIVRDSLSWLHRGFELRVIDESLRGIAVGHTRWDLTPESVITHGWVDDMEERVISIKYGPTEEEETDVEVPRDVPVLRMSLGDRSLVRPGAGVLIGAQAGADGKHSAIFVFVGKDGIVPPM